MAKADFSIPGVEHVAVLQYFQTLNAGDFTATADLFTEEGAMQPPFESPIVGREAIATFLKSEAKEMRLEPREGDAEQLKNGQTQVQVGGKVQTALFGVNVSWQFILSSLSNAVSTTGNLSQQIVYVRIKLLASPQELIELRDHSSG
ncbi:MAG: ketosteroid isomerase family protein [Cyanophyceae cyanobacterium]